MTLVLTLPEQVEKQLYHQATIRELPPETVALELLQKAVAEDDNDFPSPEETGRKSKHYRRTRMHYAQPRDHWQTH